MRSCSGRDLDRRDRRGPLPGLWTGAPRWLSTALYIALGWTAVFGCPQLVEARGLSRVALLFSGGCSTRWAGSCTARAGPEPSLPCFGFHEVFHAFTVAPYLAQYVAVLAGGSTRPCDAGRVTR
ncbi:hemolysin III family protein [Streptosporangium vulgare]|uniref:hemolysin III family protein n=1 Tax=Streptosporangium vulgare TaxID=46190 RepID=UPI003383FF80